MTLLDHFRDMARNNLWSNHRLYDACSMLGPEALAERRVGFFPSLHLTLHHILVVDLYYIDAVEEGGQGLAVYRAPDSFPNFAALRQAQSESDRRLIAFCDRLGEVDLDRRVKLVRTVAVPPEKIGNVLAHLFVHQIHHRGQAHAMLSGTAVAPPQLDEFFLEGDAPLNRDELAALGISRTA